MQFTLSRAAKEASVSKSTLSKALSTGRLSGDRQQDGSFRIEAAELFRVFPRRTPEAVVRTELATVREPSEERGERGGSEASVLLLRVRMLEDQLARERALHDHEREMVRETVLDLRKRLDRAEERVLALSPPASQPPVPAEPIAAVPSAPSKPPAGFLARLFGRT